MPRINPLFLLPVLVMAAVSAIAAPPVQTGNLPPDLAGTVRAALQRHPEYQTLAPVEQEADALRARARSLVSAHPSLSMRLQDDQLGTDRGQREWEAGVELPIWRPGERRASQDLALVAHETAMLRQQSLALVVAGEVREAAWAIAIARNHERLAARELDTARALERQVSILHQRGEVPRSDLLQAREETLQRANEHNAARLETHHALLAYQALTGMQAVPEALVESRAEGTIEGNPLLVEAQSRVSRMLAEQALVRKQAGTPPILSIGGRSEQDGSGLSSNSLGIGITIPLGLASQRAVPEAAAALQLARAQADRDHQLRGLSLALTEAEESIAMSEQGLEIAQARHDLAAENLRLAQQAYTLGETPIAELLRTQTRAFAAERDAVLGAIERDRAIARYNQALGVMP